MSRERSRDARADSPEFSGESARALTRRRLLAVGGAAALGTVAGCTGTQDESGSGGTTARTTGENAGNGPGSTATTEDAGALLGGHPAATMLDAQPRLGPAPTDAEGVVVAFEDPSCPRCAAFERRTVSKLRERHPDRVSVVFWCYPVVYPWGKPASQAIESAFAREVGSMGSGKEMSDGTTMNESGTTMADETTTGGARYGAEQGSVATWKLIRHYFENQSRFDEGNVLDLTREFLATETDLDADAVVADAAAKKHDDAVQADLSAGEEAGAGSTTPTVFLFRDGEFRTSAKGSVSFDVITSALGL
ncbi:MULTISPECIES: DsbA family protein [Halorussus]|uniref:DsbA family protein n=1 Tax=Halorussus TaxID=1070314 RepID=UPI0020A1533C|nr:DsbA family protein [Halorussus vallis]USZ76218.1 DsbA family protein [Halorussus vallis]